MEPTVSDGFIYLHVATGDETEEMWALSTKLISSVGPITKKSEIIEMATPIHGMAAINLITSSTMVVNHSVEEIIEALGAVRVKYEACVKEKKEGPKVKLALPPGTSIN